MNPMSANQIRKLLRGILLVAMILSLCFGMDGLHVVHAQDLGSGDSNRHTGSHHAPNRHTGSHHAFNRHTGSNHASDRYIGANCDFDRYTGANRYFDRYTWANCGFDQHTRVNCNSQRYARADRNADGCTTRGTGLGPVSKRFHRSDHPPV